MTKTKTKKSSKYSTYSSKPNFQGWENWTGDEYHKQVRDARRYYYEGYKEADLVKYVWTWMSQNGYTPEQIRYAQNASGSITPSSVIGINCRLLLDGMPDYNEKYAYYWNELRGTSSDLKPLSETLKEVINYAIEDGKLRVIEKKDESDAPRETRSVQDKVNDSVRIAAVEIDEWLNEFKSRNWKPDQFDFRLFFEKHEFSVTHAKRLASLYLDERDRFEQLVKTPTKKQMESLSEIEIDQINQIKEGYSNLSKLHASRYYEALCRLIQECEAFANTKKAIKSTVKKITPKKIENQVSKLKYLANDTTNNLTSISPQSIVGAEVLWIYNTKTRKLGRYVAQKIDPNGMRRPGSGLSVKGSTIVDFDPEKSVQKTVRKPAETLREFSAANKVKLRTFLDNLSTVESRMNGRINGDIILLRVF